MGIREHIMKPYLAGDFHAAVRRAGFAISKKLP